MSPDSSSLERPTPTVIAPVRRRRLWPWIVAALLIIAAVAGWALWGRAPDTASTAPGPGGKGGRGDAASRPMPVVAATARQGSIDVVLSALGTVTPRNMATVKSRVDGPLLSVKFQEGQLVKVGDLLAEIDPRTFQVALTQAEGQKAKDQALLANARVDLERYQTLLSQDSIAKQQVDTQEALVRQYIGVVDADQGAVDAAKLQLSFTKITAPIAGRVGLRQVDPGNMIHATDTNGIVVITQMAPTTAVFPVPEDNLPRVTRRFNSGEAIPVDAYDREGKTKLASGKLASIDNQIDITTGTVKLKAEFANTDGTLFPNQFVNIRMPVERRDDVILVPSAAIQRGAPGTFVYTVRDDSTVAVSPVKVGAVQGETTEVQSGVKAGDRVVVDGADKLRDGAKVELVDPNARNPSPAAGKRQGSGQGDAGANAAPGTKSKGDATGAPAPATGTKDAGEGAPGDASKRGEGRRRQNGG
jgi:multidrug efflux system membrane fusion protein